MFNRDFCDILEYEITQAFNNSNNDLVKGFWCDGVILQNSNILEVQNSILKNKEIILKAFLGKDGQTEYELILKFGNKSLNSIKNNLDIMPFIQLEGKQNWFKIDTSKKKLVIQLD